MRVLVAGATGAIGRALVPVLARWATTSWPTAAADDGLRRPVGERRDGAGGRPGCRSGRAPGDDGPAGRHRQPAHGHPPPDRPAPPRPRLRSHRPAPPGGHPTRRQPPARCPTSTSSRGARLRLRADMGRRAGGRRRGDAVLGAPPGSLRRTSRRCASSSGSPSERAARCSAWATSTAGTIYAAHGLFTQQVRAGQAPMVGGGTSVFSFSHVHDVATAVGRGGPPSDRPDQRRGRRPGPDVDLAPLLR